MYAASCAYPEDPLPHHLGVGALLDCQEGSMMVDSSQDRAKDIGDWRNARAGNRHIVEAASRRIAEIAISEALRPLKPANHSA